MTGKISLLTLAIFFMLLVGVDCYSQTPEATPTPSPTPTQTPTPDALSPSPYPTSWPFSIQSTRRRPAQPAQLNKPADVTALELDKTEIVLGCPEGLTPGKGCATSEIVDVQVKAVDPEDDVLIYNYSVSGGKIENQGANVKWNLSDVKPGTYTITAGVDDGCGVCGKTMTKDIVVKECASCVDNACECFLLEVQRGAETVKQGHTVTFTANVSGGNVEIEKYNWYVTGGRIVEGQGTKTIRVAATVPAGQSITATVEVGGDSKCFRTCLKVSSETVPVTNY